MPIERGARVVFCCVLSTPSWSSACSDEAAQQAQARALVEAEDDSWLDPIGDEDQGAAPASAPANPKAPAAAGEGPPPTVDFPSEATAS